MKGFLSIFAILLLLSGCQQEDKKENLVENNTGDAMFTINNYTNTLISNLELYSDKLIENLTKINSLDFYSKVDLLDFSAFMEPTRNELSIIMYSMDKDANEVFFDGNDPKVFAGSIYVLENIVYYEETTNQKDKFLDFYEKNEEEIVIAEQEVIKNWFMDCWQKAINTEFKLPAYFSFHDEYKSYDLKNNKWISEDDIWSSEM